MGNLLCVLRVCDRRASVAAPDKGSSVNPRRPANISYRHLQVADIDSRPMLVYIQRGKGGRDRYVPLSPLLLTTLRVYYR